jgi:hypothetical protein
MDRKWIASSTLTTGLVRLSESLAEFVSPPLVGIVAKGVAEFMSDGKIEQSV